MTFTWVVTSQAHRLLPLIICCTLYAVCVWPGSASPWHYVSNMAADETITSKCCGQSETYLVLWLNMMRFLQQQKSSIVTTNRGNKRIHETRQNNRQTGTCMSLLNLYTMSRTVFLLTCICGRGPICLNVAKVLENLHYYNQGGCLHFMWFFQTPLTVFPGP
jgi:hypothetical protein